MLSKANIKYIRSLQQKKYRQRYDKFIVEGTKIISEILQYPNIDIEYMIASSSWLQKYSHLYPHIPIIESNEKIMKELSSFNTPSDVLVVIPTLSPSLDENIIQNDISLFLDGIQDPGNLGTILRIADWFGIQHVFLGEGTVDLYNPKVIQSSMGAFLRVHCFHYSIENLAEQFPNIPIMGADLQGDNIFELSPEKKKGIIVIGNEGNGISNETRKYIHQRINIPAHGKAESLNAAVATGIICAIFRN